MSEWIDVNDRLPKNGKHIVAISNFSTSATYIDGRWLQCGLELQYDLIHHWMPLPKPPTNN